MAALLRYRGQVVRQHVQRTTTSDPVIIELGQGKDGSTMDADLRLHCKTRHSGVGAEWLV